MEDLTFIGELGRPPQGIEAGHRGGQGGGGRATQLGGIGGGHRGRAPGGRIIGEGSGPDGARRRAVESRDADRPAIPVEGPALTDVTEPAGGRGAGRQAGAPLGALVVLNGHGPAGRQGLPVRPVAGDRGAGEPGRLQAGRQGRVGVDRGLDGQVGGARGQVFPGDLQTGLGQSADHPGGRRGAVRIGGGDGLRDGIAVVGPGRSDPVVHPLDHGLGDRIAHLLGLDGAVPPGLAGAAKDRAGLLHRRPAEIVLMHLGRLAGHPGVKDPTLGAGHGVDGVRGHGRPDPMEGHGPRPVAAVGTRIERQPQGAQFEGEGRLQAAGLGEGGQAAQVGVVGEGPASGRRVLAGGARDHGRERQARAKPGGRRQLVLRTHTNAGGSEHRARQRGGDEVPDREGLGGDLETAGALVPLDPQRGRVHVDEIGPEDIDGVGQVGGHGPLDLEPPCLAGLQAGVHAQDAHAVFGGVPLRQGGRAFVPLERDRVAERVRPQHRRPGLELGEVGKHPRPAGGHYHGPSRRRRAEPAGVHRSDLGRKAPQIRIVGQVGGHRLVVRNFGRGAGRGGSEPELAEEAERCARSEVRVLVNAAVLQHIGRRDDRLAALGLVGDVAEMDGGIGREGGHCRHPRLDRRPVLQIRHEDPGFLVGIAGVHPHRQGHAQVPGQGLDGKHGGERPGAGFHLPAMAGGGNGTGIRDSIILDGCGQPGGSA